MNEFETYEKIIQEQLGQDTPVALATCADNRPAVRMVNMFYREGSLYFTSHSGTTKMQHIAQNPQVAVCKETIQLFGEAKNLGHPNDNEEIRELLRQEFQSFYETVVHEEDPGTCFGRIDVNSAYVCDEQSKTILNFADQSVQRIVFSELG